jgi:hypothetical protein
MQTKKKHRLTWMKTAETRVELGILGLKSYPVVGCTLPHPLHVQSHRASKLRDRMKLKRYLIIGVSALLSQTQKFVLVTWRSSGGNVHLLSVP